MKPIDPLSDKIVVCTILYSEDFKSIISILNALLDVKELSLRSLFITGEAISKIPAHYTVWEYRSRIVKHLCQSNSYKLEDEIEWCNSIALNNEKNYQIWHYKEIIIEFAIKMLYNNDPSSYPLLEEYNIVNEMLSNDEKNYHVWTHKRWMVRCFNLWRDNTELEIIDRLIDEDVRNNSAWSHRYLVLFGNTQEIKEIDQEIDYIFAKIDIAPTNLSSWNYLSGVIEIIKKKDEFKLFTNLEEKFLKYINDGKGIQNMKLDGNYISIPALKLLAEFYIAKERKDEAVNIYEALKVLDEIRVKYWEFKQSTLL